MGFDFTEKSARRISNAVKTVERSPLINNQYQRRGVQRSSNGVQGYSGMYELSFDTRVPPSVITIAAGIFVSGAFQETIASDTVNLAKDLSQIYVILRAYYDGSLQTEYVTDATFNAHDTVTVGGSTYYRYNALLAQITYDTAGNIASWQQYAQGPIHTAGVFTIS